MRKKYIYAFSLFVIFFIGISAFYVYNMRSYENLNSPVPDFLMRNENKQVSSLDFWLPTLFGFFDSTSEVPILTAKSVLVYDLNEEKPLFEKNPNTRLPMASLTKIMTAMIAIDNAREDDRYVVRDEHLVGENTIGLSVGEVMSLEELLYGVFMYSANDAAEVLAGDTMNRGEFIKAMNDKARALGIENTNFTNPTGFQGDGDQYSTAYDLLVISKHALENYPLIEKTSSTSEHHLPESEDHYEYYLYSQLNLLTTYPGVKGFKDGFTPEAGWCLITYYEKDGEEYLGIILGSEDRRGEMIELLDYSLTQNEITPPPHI